MKRRVGDAGGDVEIGGIVLIGGLAALYFFVVKPLMNALGPNTDATLAAQQAMPPGQNPFSYQFQPFIDFYNNNTPTIVSSSGTWGGLEAYLGISPSTGSNSNPTIQQFFQGLAASTPTQSPWGLLDAVQLTAMAQNIYNAMTPSGLNALNPLGTTDQTAAVSSVSGFTNQLQVAFVANYLWWNEQVDMLTYLAGSATKFGLTPANLDALINQVNALPVNPSV